MYHSTYLEVTVSKQVTSDHTKLLEWLLTHISDETGLSQLIFFYKYKETSLP